MLQLQEHLKLTYKYIIMSDVVKTNDTLVSKEIINMLKSDDSRKLALKLLEKSKNKVLYFMLLDSQTIKNNEYEFDFS